MTTNNIKTTGGNAKTKKMLVGIIAVAVMTTAAVSIVGCRDQSQKDNGVTLNVACNIPLTGLFSEYGESIRDGILFAMQEMKSDLQSKNVVVKYDFQDNKSTTKDAQMVVRKQFLKPVDIYVGGIAQPLYSILKIVDEKNIPFFTWGVEEYLLTDYENTYRTWVNFNGEAQCYIDYIKKVNPKKVFIARPQTIGTELQFNNKIIPFLNSMGIEHKMEVFENSKSDFKDIALKAKQYDADLYIINGFDFHLIDMVKNFRINDMISSKNVYWSFDLLDAANKLDKTVLEGLRVTAPRFIIANEDYEKWGHRFKEKFNRQPRYTDAYAYDMAYILAYLAIKKSEGKQIENFKELFSEMRLKGITGELYFRDDRDLVYDMETCIYRNGILEKETP